MVVSPTDEMLDRLYEMLIRSYEDEACYRRSGQYKSAHQIHQNIGLIVEKIRDLGGEV